MVEELFVALLPMVVIDMLIAKNLFALLMLFASSLLWADVTEVDNDALQKLIAQGVPVIDVRRQDEWQQSGVIDGAHLLTFFDKQGRYDVDKWLSELDKIASKDSPVILICAAGVRSKNIADLMNKRLGYTGVHNHTKGMFNWLEKGKPVVTYSDKQTEKKMKKSVDE